MGLAGRKQQQRIPADPRNLSWADDASRFGLSYLSKFGWDASQGLGSSGDGTKTHLKIQQKLDMMGIGAQHQRDPNGIAWKQNKEFEALLKRLNESTEEKRGDAEGECRGVHETAIDKAFVSAQEERIDQKIGDQLSVAPRKRKHEDREDKSTIDIARKKLKKGKKEKKEKRPKSSSDDTGASLGPPLAPFSSGLTVEPMPKPRPMAHRARVRAAKRIAGKSASAIAEILGIAPSSSMSSSTSTPPSTTLSSSVSTPQPSLSLDNLTTSTKSVMDYFKEKLLARSHTPSSLVLSSAPSRSGISPYDEDELLRRGIGSQAPAIRPPSQALEPLVSEDGGDMSMEKQRRKAKHRGEKRRRREAEAKHIPLESVSTSVEEQMKADDITRVQKTLKEKKSRSRKQRSPIGEGDDGIAEKRQEHDTPSGSLPEPRKKSKQKKDTFVSNRAG